MIRPWIGSHPDTVYLYPTMICNLRCKMCYSGGHQDSIRAREEELSLVEYKCLIEELYRHGVRNFDISGGEPLLRKDIYKIFEYIKSYSDTVLFVVCNGTLIKNNLTELEPCLKFIDRLYISIDSPFKEEHNRIRATNRAFENAMEGLAALRSCNFDNIGINFVVMKQNCQQITDMLEIVRRESVRYINFLRLIDVSSQSDFVEQNLNSKDISDAYMSIIKWAEDTVAKGFYKPLDIKLVLPGFGLDNIKEHKSVAKLPENIKLEIQYDPIRGCPAFGNSLVITTNGSVTGCTAMVAYQDFHKGNVREEALEDILGKWNDMRKLLRDREKALKSVKPCADCTHWSACRGGCPAVAYKYYSTIMKPDPTCPMVLNNK